MGKFNILALNCINLTFALLDHVMGFLKLAAVSLLAALILTIQLVAHLCFSLPQRLFCLGLQIGKLLLEFLLELSFSSHIFLSLPLHLLDFLVVVGN